MQVAQSTILPKSDLAGESNESKMIFAESKGNSYYFDYTSQPAGQPMVCLVSVHFQQDRMMLLN